MEPRDMDLARREESTDVTSMIRGDLASDRHLDALIHPGAKTLMAQLQVRGLYDVIFESINEVGGGLPRDGVKKDGIHAYAIRLP